VAQKEENLILKGNNNNNNNNNNPICKAPECQKTSVALMAGCKTFSHYFNHNTAKMC